MKTTTSPSLAESLIARTQEETKHTIGRWGGQKLSKCRPCQFIPLRTYPQTHRPMDLKTRKVRSMTSMLPSRSWFGGSAICQLALCPSSTHLHLQIVTPRKELECIQREPQMPVDKRWRWIDVTLFQDVVRGKKIQQENTWKNTAKPWSLECTKNGLNHENIRLKWSTPGSKRRFKTLLLFNIV